MPDCLPGIVGSDSRCIEMIAVNVGGVPSFDTAAAVDDFAEQLPCTAVEEASVFLPLRFFITRSPLAL